MSRTIQRAVDTLGGVEVLAERLRVTPDRVAGWLSGTRAPSTEEYLTALDIVALRHRKH